MKILSKRAFWSIHPLGIAALAQAEHKEIEPYPDETFRELFKGFYNQRRPMSQAAGVAYIDARGALLDDATEFEKGTGNTGYDEIIADLKAVENSGSASAVVFTGNSPGGSASGIKEVCEVIESMQTPVVFHATGMCCSAMYHIAAACDAIIASPSAEVGNIGCVMHWHDMSEMLEGMGIKSHVITNEGADLKDTFYKMPVEGSHLEFLQENVTAKGEAFWNYVVSRRPAVAQEAKRAGWYSGEEAGKMGLIDGIGSVNDAAQMALTLAQQSPVDIEN